MNRLRVDSEKKNTEAEEQRGLTGEPEKFRQSIMGEIQELGRK